MCSQQMVQQKHQQSASRRIANERGKNKNSVLFGNKISNNDFDMMMTGKIQPLYDTVHFDATVPPTAMLHLQNRCICTCTTTIRLDIEHEKKNSHNHKVSSNVEFPALLSFASRKGKWLSIVVFELKRPPDVLQNAPPNVGNLM